MGDKENPSVDDSRTTDRKANGTFAKGNSIGVRFKAGEVNNPKGLNGSITQILRQQSSEVIDGETRSERIAKNLLDLADPKHTRGADLRAIMYYFDRIDGKTKEFVEQRVVRDEVIIR